MERDIVVIGGSAGSIEALCALVSRMPVELPATVLVVVHVPATSQTALPQILERCGRLPASLAKNDEKIRKGHIYIAPPDHHLALYDHKLRVARGPRENGHRPAIDPLFRSAARWAGPRTIGVVLSGVLDDGTAGMIAVRMRGGLCIVQSPNDALFPGMPQSVIDHVEVDAVMSATELGEALSLRVREPISEESMISDEPADAEEDLENEDDKPEIDAKREQILGPASGYTCPECHVDRSRRSSAPDLAARYAAKEKDALARAQLIRGAIDGGREPKAARADEEQRQG